MNTSEYQVHLVTITVRVVKPGLFAEEQVWEEFSPHPSHPRNALTDYFTDEPATRSLRLTVPFAILSSCINTGAGIVDLLFDDTVINTLGSSLYIDDEREEIGELPSSPEFGRPLPFQLEQTNSK